MERIMLVTFWTTLGSAELLVSFLALEGSSNGIVLFIIQ